MKKLIKKIGVGVVLTILIAVIIISVNKYEKDNNIEGSDVLLIKSESKETIYINKSLLLNRSNLRPFAFDCREKDILYNQTEALSIVNSFLKNPVYEKISSSPYRKKYIDNVTGSYVILEDGDRISYTDRHHMMMLPNETNSNDTIIKEAKKIIHSVRGRTDDLKLAEIYSVKVHKGNTSTNKTELIGIDYQCIKFNQYYNGYKIGGMKGDIRITFGKDARIRSYDDSTIRELITQNMSYRISDINTSLSKMNLMIRGESSGKYNIEDLELIIFSNGYRFEPLYLKWEIKLRSQSNQLHYAYIDAVV